MPVPAMKFVGNRSGRPGIGKLEGALFEGFGGGSLGPWSAPDLGRGSLDGGPLARGTPQNSP